MKKRAVDLSIEELAALGANAALRAANDARNAELPVTGTVDFLEDDQGVSALAEYHPSGTVKLLGDSVTERKSNQVSGAAKPNSRQSLGD